jgi:hypothetical protein
LLVDQCLTCLDGIIINGAVVPLGGVGAIVPVSGRRIEPCRHTPSEESLKVSKVGVGDGPLEGLEDVGYAAVGTDMWATEPSSESGGVAVKL